MGSDSDNVITDSDEEGWRAMTPMPKKTKAKKATKAKAKKGGFYEEAYNFNYF
jgi:hypothetical protein